MEEYVILVRHGSGHSMYKGRVDANDWKDAKEQALAWLVGYAHRAKVTELKLDADHLTYARTVLSGPVGFGETQNAL